MEYYRVHDDCVLLDRNNNVLGEGGDVVPLATDSDDKTERQEAEGILLGQHHSVNKVPGPKKAKKKATYKTKDATPEG